MTASSHRRYVWMPLALLLLAAALIGLTAGKYPLTLTGLWNALASGPAPLPDAQEHVRAATVVFWELRVPRVVAGLLAGAALAAAGATYQGIFRNPLVSPDILGVSAGAGVGAAWGLFMGLSAAWVQLLAFGTGLLAVALVYFIARAARRHDAVLVLVLAGVAVSTALGAVISLVKLLADPYTQLPSITFWMLGGLSAVTRADLGFLLFGLAGGLLPMIVLRWRINLLSLSDEEAGALGVHAPRLRLALILAATFMTASTVAFTGIIGWVGLVVPHLARLLAGPDFSRLLPTSLLLGAAFVVVADTLARTLTSIELPLGILTALVGAPFFLALLARGQRQ